ncbi:phage late control D family protein [Chromobacterium subtsugae]|uniref:phage late control D family protein n=1 Tax=Chromobacterium subtsugae TaxID=251747 RepID=UPI000640F08D|nr:contractile injection system protein, VgrG/Pvc8 family [Chromobacterium subtsugae]
METLTGMRDPARPAFKIQWAGRQVSEELTPFILRLSYTDHEEGQSDSMDITLEDVDGRFRSGWYPTHGDRLRLQLGYQDGEQLDGGEFEIDEVELSGPPDIVVIRALAAGVTLPQRTPQGRGYDDTTLAAIAQSIAGRQKLALIGRIEPIRIIRATQIHETDLAFLRRLAGEYGYAFSVKGGRLVFCKLEDLHRGKPVLELRRGDISRYGCRDKIKGVVRQASVSYHDPRTRQCVSHSARQRNGTASGDAIKLNSRVESAQQARVKAEAAMTRQRLEATSVSLTLYGNPKLVAGVNFSLLDMGALSGIYHIVSSRHEMDRGGGYRTEVEARRLARKTGKGDM